MQFSSCRARSQESPDNAARTHPEAEIERPRNVVAVRRLVDVAPCCHCDGLMLDMTKA